MIADPVTLSPTAHTALLELAADLGKPVGEVLEAAITEYRLRHPRPIAHIDGVDPADIWAAAADVEAGNSITHDELMARLRARP